MKDALIVFAKVPTPGAVKTRLCPPLTPEAAADLYAAMLGDALAQYAALGTNAHPVAVRLYLPPADTAIAPEIWPEKWTGETFAQTGEGLGARMLRAFAETFAAGFERAVVVGTDHPTLPSGFLRLAFDELAVAGRASDEPAAPRTVTLGPSDDGGFYAMGLSNLVPALFAGMTYSHADVLTDTLDRAADAGLDVTLLPPWYDVDDADGLARLRADLAAADETDDRANDPLAPRTRAALGRLDGLGKE